jgi:NADH dehydrogenase
VRVAVTGGTGFVGTHLVRTLSDAGHEVVALARGTKRRPRRPGVTFVRADLTDSPPLVDAFAGCDAVVHLVAVIREKRAQTFERVNRQATERVADAARQAKVPHLIHQSANGVDPDPRYPYLASKWAGEQAVRASGVPFTVLRPSTIFGPGDGFFTVIARLVRLSLVGPIPFVVPVAGDGQALFQPIFIDDVVRCITIALERGPGSAAHTIGGPEHLSYDDIVLTVKSALGARRLLLHIPVRLMLPPVFVMEHVMPNPMVTLGQLRLLEKHNITRLDAVREAFGFDPERFADNADYLNDY